MARMQQNIALKFSFKKKLHRFSLDTKAEQLNTVLIEKDQIDTEHIHAENQYFGIRFRMWSLAVILSSTCLIVYSSSCVLVSSSVLEG